MADTVAEVVGGRDRRKDRIRIPVATNRSCVAVHRCQSMLRARVGKILLQQYRHVPDEQTPSRSRPLWHRKRTLSKLLARPACDPQRNLHASALLIALANRGRRRALPLYPRGASLSEASWVRCRTMISAFASRRFRKFAEHAVPCHLKAPIWPLVPLHERICRGASQPMPPRACLEFATPLSGRV